MQGDIVQVFTEQPFSVVTYDTEGNPTSTPSDPDVVVFLFQVDGSEPVQYTYGTDEEVVRDGVGLYHVDLDTTPFTPPTTDPFRVTYEWASSGAPQVTDAGSFMVEQPPLVPSF